MVTFSSWIILAALVLIVGIVAAYVFVDTSDKATEPPEKGPAQDISKVGVASGQ